MVNPLLYFSGVALSAFLTGVSKAGLGGNMGVLITPILALVIPADQAIGLLLPIFILGDVFALMAHWRRWNGRLVVRLIPAGMVGVTLGTFVLTSISAVTLQRFLGVIVFLFLIYRLVENRLLKGVKYQARGWHGWVAGGVGGFTSALAHAGGPPVAVYLLMQDLAPQVFVATSVLFFAVINWIKVPYYYQAGLLDFAAWLRLIWLVPLVPIGVWVGKRFVQRIDRRLFEQVILVLLTMSGVLLLTR